METKLSRSELYKIALNKLMDTAELDPSSILAPLFTENIIKGLKHLDTEIARNRVNLRSIKNYDYIREIYESYLVEEKVEIQDVIMNTHKKLLEKRNTLKKEVDELRKIHDQNKHKLKDLENEVIFYRNSNI